MVDAWHRIGSMGPGIWLGRMRRAPSLSSKPAQGRGSVRKGPLSAAESLGATKIVN